MLESAAMPLPVSEVERELTHTRRVRYEGYKRTDGLWDIEAHLLDTKNHDFHLKTGVRRAGQAIHDMWLRVTIDRSFTILDAHASMDAAECIQCGACVAQCPNGAAQLFTAAKVSHLGMLPQGQPERHARVLKMVEVMEDYFGSCTMFRECEAVCPKEISVDFIARMNRDYIAAQLKSR